MGLQAQQTYKACTGCSTVKPVQEFHRRCDAPNAKYRARCKSCMYSASQKNPKLRGLQNAWRERNREQVNAQARERGAAHPEKRSAAFEKWRLQNMEQCAERSRRRDATKRGAVPAWADREKIKAFYIEARRLTKLTGVPHEVDHIYPLVSDVMCGLHVETNLQILTKSANSAKKNKVALCL